MCGSQSQKPCSYSYSLPSSKLTSSQLSLHLQLFHKFRCQIWISSSSSASYWYIRVLTYISIFFGHSQRTSQSSLSLLPPQSQWYSSLHSAGLSLFVCYYPSAAPYSNGYPAFLYGNAAALIILLFRYTWGSLTFRWIVWIASTKYRADL